MLGNNSDVNSDAVSERWYSADDLAEMNLPGYPRSGRRIHDRAKVEGWKFRTIPSSGRVGMKMEYSPPPNVLALITARVQPRPEKHEAREPVPKPHLQAPDGFVLVPRYDVSGSMGNGHVIHSEQIVDHLAFRAEWVRTELGTNPNNLALISAVGDSMEPTLRAHDLLLIDRSVLTVKQDAIYAFAVDGELRIKRIQRLFDGSLVIKSDNPGYSAETLPPDQSGLINIVGRVVWSGRRM